MKKLFVACLLFCSPIWAITPLQKSIAQTVGCYRDLVHSTAGWVSAEYLQSHLSVFPILDTYRTVETEAVPALHKDVTDEFIALIGRYSSESPTELEVHLDKKRCEKLKKSKTRVNNKTSYKDKSIYLPTRGLEPDMSVLVSSKNAQDLVYSTLLKDEKCYRVEGHGAFGLMLVGAVGINIGFCKGQGGRQWIVAAPQIHAGMGGGAGILVGGKETSDHSGWYRYLDFKYSGMVGAGWLFGVYRTGNDKGLHGGGIGYGFPGFILNMAGTNLDIKLLYVQDDYVGILEALGQEVEKSDIDMNQTANWSAP